MRLKCEWNESKNVLMKINVNKKILDLDNPTDGTLVPFVGYILKYYWDGKLPIDINKICKSLNINIVFSDNVDISENDISNNIIYINKEYFNNKDEFYLNLEISTQVGFILRKICTKNLDRTSELFTNGVKQARHLLMPDDILIADIISKTEKCEIYNKFKNIPKNEIDTQFEKVKRKFNL